MIKNRFFTAIAFAGLVGFAACAAEEEEPVDFDTAPLEEATPAPPITPAPITEDTMTPALPDTTMTDSVTM
jgi:hypothetical protein